MERFGVFAAHNAFIITEIKSLSDILYVAETSNVKIILLFFDKYKNIDKVWI